MAFMIEAAISVTSEAIKLFRQADNAIAVNIAAAEAVKTEKFFVKERAVPIIIEKHANEIISPNRAIAKPKLIDK